jgi:predicted acylesterase/phospholipase RssA
MRTAVIMAGAVAKGAFGAGVLDVLTGEYPDIEIIRLVGTSSGALNATMMAAGVHRGEPRQAALDLVEQWTESGGLFDVLSLSLKSMLQLRGFSDQRKLKALLASKITACPGVGRARTDLLHILVANLDSTLGTIFVPGDATTFEQPYTFGTADFSDAVKLERVFDASGASAAFPVLFAPGSVDAATNLVDGGAVNNAPIKYALSVKDVELVMMVASTMQKLEPDPNAGGAWFPPLSGTRLLTRLVDTLINERLYRDLREAVDVNTALQAFEQFDPELRRQVLAALGWEHRRKVEIVIVQPSEPLPGSSFSGFLSRKQRIEYIERGRQRAREVLGAPGAPWHAAPSPVSSTAVAIPVA